MQEIMYHAKDYGPADQQVLADFVTSASRYETLRMQEVVRDFANFKGWWQGAHSSGALHALACVGNNAASIYGDSHEAITTLAAAMARSAKNQPSTGGTHQILGPKSVIDAYWGVFHQVNRTVVRDQRRELLAATAVEEGKSAYSVEVAKATDAPLVLEFTAESSIDQWGADPRKANKAGHEARCAAAIQQGRMLIGRQRGKPVFVCEQVPLGDGTIMLEQAHIPAPLRRPRVVAGVMAHAARAALASTSEVLIFVDLDKEPWSEACGEIGFVSKTTYRQLLLR